MICLNEKNFSLEKRKKKSLLLNEKNDSKVFFFLGETASNIQVYCTFSISYAVYEKEGVLNHKVNNI